MYLDPYCEIIGILHSIHKDELGTKAVITINKEIILPLAPKNLKNFLGKHVQIFNNNGTYIIKERVP
jgi:hypothetical protein